MGKRGKINNSAFGVVAFFLIGGILLLFIAPAIGYAGAIIAAILMVVFIFSRIIR